MKGHAKKAATDGADLTQDVLRLLQDLTRVAPLLDRRGRLDVAKFSPMTELAYETAELQRKTNRDRQT